MVDKVKRPKPKREVAIDFIDRISKTISFDATADAVEDLREFGQIYPLYGNHYVLMLDARYDLKEIIEFLENYG